MMSLSPKSCMDDIIAYSRTDVAWKDLVGLIVTMYKPMCIDKKARACSSEPAQYPLPGLWVQFVSAGSSLRTPSTYNIRSTASPFGRRHGQYTATRHATGPPARHCFR